jgi:hypothetical protein
LFLVTHLDNTFEEIIGEDDIEETNFGGLILLLCSLQFRILGCVDSHKLLALANYQAKLVSRRTPILFYIPHGTKLSNLVDLERVKVNAEDGFCGHDQFAIYSDWFVGNLVEDLVQDNI